MEEILIKTNSYHETVKLGQEIAQFILPTMVITLSGDLGAGKTAFTSGLAKGLGIKDQIISPTFNILKCYFDTKIPLFHIDAYRLEDGRNKDIGLEEYIEGDGVAIIEWPQFIVEMIPDDSLKVEIYIKGDNQREIIFKTNSHKYDKIMSFLQGVK